MASWVLVVFPAQAPKDLQPILGATPIRFRLPCRSRREASRYARQLVGLAEQHMAAMRYSERTFDGNSASLSSELPFISRRIGSVRLSKTTTSIRMRENKRSRRVTPPNVRLIDSPKERIGKLADLATEHRALDSLMEDVAQEDKEALAQSQQVIARKSLRGWSEFATQWLEDFDALLRNYQSKRT